MKVQASDIQQSFITGITNGLAPFDITVTTKLSTKIGILFADYSLMGFTVIGDWETLNNCKDFVEKYVARKAIEIGEKWKQYFTNDGVSTMHPMNKRKLEKDYDDTNFSTGEIAPIDSSDDETITTPNIKSKIHSTADDTDTETMEGIEYYNMLIKASKNVDYLTYMINDIAYQLFDQTSRFY